MVEDGDVVVCWNDGGGSGARNKIREARTAGNAG